MATPSDPQHSTTPHPLLIEPILFVVDVPEYVKWHHLESFLSTCGDVRSGKRGMTQDGRRRWKIHFANLFEAEMALATLSGLPVPGLIPSWVLTLSHMESLDSALPKDPLCAQFVKGSPTGIHGLQAASAQRIFRLFRPIGPLVSVRTNINTGYPQRTCVIQYWNEKDADYARGPVREFSDIIRTMGPFTLRTFTQYNLLCSNLGPAFLPADVSRIFGKFGRVIYTRLAKSGSSHCHCFLSFNSQGAAAAAIAELNDTVLNGHTIRVRYREPGNQADFRLLQTKDVRNPFAAASDDTEIPLKPKTEAEMPPNEPDQGSKDQKPAQDHTRRASEEARTRADLQQKLLEATRKREQAQAEENVARAETSNAIAQEGTTKASLVEAVSDRKNAAKELSEASSALLEAEKALQAAKVRQQEALDWISKASSVESSSQGAAIEATTRRIEAEVVEQYARAAREQAEHDEETLRSSMPEMDEATRRQLELEEMIRRMKELRDQEENDRRERQMREQREKEEAERVRKEAERLAREERDRQAREEQARKAHEEQERRYNEARRLQEYRDAAAKERDRCIQRDSGWSSWNDARHVNWYKAVSIEFDDIKFCASQPLTFASVPWPLLSPPQKYAFDDIEWGAVEAFFAAVKTVVGEGEYKVLIEKAHRRFHPDKWRSRGLLTTVLDETERERLEGAGNIVAQAITPLWRASKTQP